MKFLFKNLFFVEQEAAKKPIKNTKKIFHKEQEMEIIFSKRKTIGISIFKNGIVKIRVPFGITDFKIKEVLLLKEDWIFKKMKYLKENQVIITNLKKENNLLFYFLGKEYKMEVIIQKKNKVELIEDFIIIYKKEHSLSEKILNDWLKKEAFIIFKERLEVNFTIFSQYYKYKFPNLKLRRMKARWGSMSNFGTMILNIKLAQTPLKCIDYVVMHELCHLKFKNHGRKFHELQKQFTPNYKEIKKELNLFVF